MFVSKATAKADPPCEEPKACEVTSGDGAQNIHRLPEETLLTV
jgi:hypothetical protein